MVKWWLAALCLARLATAGPDPKSDVVAQMSRYFEPGGSEEYYVYCPPGANKSTLCDLVKMVNDVETQKGQMKFGRAFSVVEQFLGQLPKGDVSGPDEPAAQVRGAESDLLWQVRLGKRWSKGVLSRGEILKPTDVNTKRLQAIHGLQWRMMDVLNQGK